MRNRDFGAFFEKNLVLAGKWAWPPHWPQRFWGLKTRLKKWTHWVDLKGNRYLENMFHSVLIYKIYYSYNMIGELPHYL